jgi:outer membrane protein assembly factor BamB
VPDHHRTQPQVFISYAREDHTFACEVYLALREKLIVPWMDKPPDPFPLEGLLPGQNWPLQIEQRIREADYVILILSPNSIQKQGFVQSEFRIALQAASWRPPNRVYVIPILRAACEVPLFVIGTIKLNDLHWIDYSAEGIAPVVEAIKRDFKPAPVPDIIRPSSTKIVDAIRNPLVRWKASVGRMHWRNNIWGEENLIFVSSSGERWNEADRSDGVYCLEKQTGLIRWGFNSNGDANEILVHEDKIVFGTDGGQLCILNKSSGVLIQDHHVWQPIFARPFVLHFGSAEHVFAISHKGNVLLAQLDKGLITQVASLPFPVRANISVSRDKQSGILFAETGEIVRVWGSTSHGFSWEVLSRKTYFQSAFHTDRRKSVLVSAPLIDGSTVVGGVVRDTYYASPPLFRFDTEDRRFLWGETDQEERPRDLSFGNLRNQPVIIGGSICFAPAYTGGIFGASRESGKILWEVLLGQQLFQQWSSPVVVDENRLILARPDGILYQVNVAEQKIEWSMSLLITPTETRSTNRSGKFWLGPSDLVDSGITSTPAWDGTCIFIGTTEGTLFCVENKI